MHALQHLFCGGGGKCNRECKLGGSRRDTSLVAQPVARMGLPLQQERVVSKVVSVTVVEL